MTQIVRCPNCNGKGWVPQGATATTWQVCPGCVTRGLLVVDHMRTMGLPENPMPLQRNALVHT